MPRAKHVELTALMQKADKLHASLKRITEEYNKVLAQAQLLHKVQQDVLAGDYVYIGDDYCQVLLKKVTAEGCTLRVLRKCNEPEVSHIAVVRDFDITGLEVVTDETE